MLFRFLLLLTMLIPELTLAANIFEPVAGDKSMVVLSSIFGSLGVFGTGGDPLAEGIRVFNGAVLTIGGLLVAYTIIIGTIGTAHDGEMLGKKFSSVWIPIRTALGTALVLPVINGTYCVMQFIVGWLIVQGIGLADKAWSAYVDSSNMEFLTSSAIMSSNARELGYRVFTAHVCMAAITQVIEDVKSAGAELTINTAAKGGTTTNPHYPQQTFYGANPEGNGFTKSSCGSIMLPTSVTINPSSNMTGAVANYFGADTAMSNASSAILTAKNNAAAQTLISSMDALAKGMIASKTVVTSDQIDAVIKEYEKEVNLATTAEVKKLKDFQTFAANAAKDGWFLAGAFYTKMAWFADTVLQAASNVPETTGPKDVAFSNPTLKDNFIKYMQLAGETSQTGKTSLSSGFGVSDENNADDSLGAQLVRYITWQPFEINNGEHPLMAMKRMGSWLLGIVFAAWALLLFVTMKAKSSGASILDALQGLFTATSVGAGIVFLSKIIMALTVPMILVGIILTYVLPMMPFFLWFGATLGWIVMCIEAILAAPMWAVMHLSPHGDDMVGTGSQGYRLVLSLMLRPVLMIFGLVASFVIIQVVGQLIAQIFSSVFAMGLSDANIFIKIIGSLIISPLMFSVVMFVLIKKSFSMIHVIPDEMLNWFGGGGPQLGSFANTVGGEQGGMMGVAAGVAMQGGQMANQISGGMKSKLAAQKDGAAKAGQLMSGAGADKDGMGTLQGLSAHRQAEVGKKINDALSAFGGAGSPQGVQFMEKYNEEAKNKPDASPEDHIKAAQEGVHASNFGSEGQDFIKEMSGGNYSGASYGRAVGKLNSLQSSLVRNGHSEEGAKTAIQGALSTALKSPEWKSEGQAEPKSTLGKAFSAAASQIQPKNGLGNADASKQIEPNSGAGNAAVMSNGNEVGEDGNQAESKPSDDEPPKE